MYNKNLIAEVNRGLQLMGLPTKKLITEQSLWKFWKSVEDLLTGAKNIPQTTDVKIGTKLDDKGNITGGIEVPRDVYNNLRSLIGNGSEGAWRNLDSEAKIFLTKIIMNNEELYNKIYNDAISDFLKSKNLTKAEFLKKVADDLDYLRKTDPLASLEDVLVRDGVDPSTARLIDGKLTNEAKPYMKWNIDDVDISARIIPAWKNFWSVYSPKIFKSVKYKWIKGYLQDVQQVKKEIQREMEIIKGKLQQISGGEAKPLNIKDNLDNIAFLIAGLRRSANESGYINDMKKYISENNYLPKDQVDEFMNQQWVKNAMEAGARAANEEAQYVGTKTLQAFMESVPVLNFFSQVWKKGGFKNLNAIDYLGLVFPNFKRLFNYAVFKTPLYMDEIAELSLRTGKTGAIVETAASYLLFETLVKPSMMASLRTIIDNYVTIPRVNEKIELIQTACMYGAIRDEQGKPIDCEALLQQVELDTEKNFYDFWREYQPFREWTSDWIEGTKQKYENYGPIGVYIGNIVAILDGVTYSDEVAASTWENIISPILFRRQPAAWDEWQKELEENYDNSMKDVISKLKSDGFNTDNPKIFEQQLEKKIDDLKKQFPEIEAGKGNFSNDLNGFKKWLEVVNKFNEIDRDKAKEFKKVDEKTKKKIYHYYLMDGSQPEGPTNPKYIWFPNKTFYPEGQTPIQ